MKRFIFILLFIWWHTCAGQTKGFFRLTGTINRDSGMINLYSIGNITDFPKYFNFSPVPVRHGKFIIEGKISHPYQVMFILKASGVITYISDGFFIEPGVQNITCNADSLKEIPIIHNSTMIEYLQKYRSVEYQSFDTINDYYKKKILERKYLYRYAQKNPESYVALWEVSKKLEGGYNIQLDSSFMVLSDKIKSSNAGKLIRNDLNHLVLTDTGKIFPQINIIDLEGKTRKLSYINKNVKYVLIDFWFSHCPPCLQQFPDYLIFVNKYGNKGFNIIGISSDSSPGDIEAWKKVIRSQSLNWLQYRASNETMRNLRITGAPYNFLLDNSGKIIAKDLSAKEVSDFLQTNLN
jgi:thiol-disulfide isomerase/thioredoxin